MIKNSQFTFDYFQPEEYRFSLDSVFLAKSVAQFLLRDSKRTKEEWSQLKVLDLCSGCGVIGMELHFHLPQIINIDFLEVQELYRPYFEKNRKLMNSRDIRFEFLQMNYDQLETLPEFENKYDLILSNPPYFFAGEGLYSPSDFKNRCRFFIDSNFPRLITSLLYSLRPEGKAYLLVRPGKHHGRNLLDEIKRLLNENQLLASAEVVDEVRGTNVVCLAKKA